MLLIMIILFNLFVFNDNYSLISMVYVMFNEVMDLRGSEYFRYFYLECIKIGMSRDYFENCVKVFFLIF